MEQSQSGAAVILASALERRALGWSRDVFPFAQQFVGMRSGLVTALAQRAVAWECAGFDAANPWEIAFDLWSHGALFWPMPDGEALVCVPPRGPDGSLSVNPDDDPPPARGERGFVASLLFFAHDALEDGAGRAPSPATAGDPPASRARWTPSGPVPEAWVLYRDGWLWTRDIRWDVGASCVLGADGRLSEESAPSRKSCRILAIDGTHWAIGPSGQREALLINSRATVARPLADGDLVELVRDGEVLFSGRYECPSQRG